MDPKEDLKKPKEFKERSKESQGNTEEIKRNNQWQIEEGPSTLSTIHQNSVQDPKGPKKAAMENKRKLKENQGKC